MTRNLKPLIYYKYYCCAFFPGRFRVQGLWFRVQGLGFRVQIVWNAHMNARWSLRRCAQGCASGNKHCNILRLSLSHTHTLSLCRSLLSAMDPASTRTCPRSVRARAQNTVKPSANKKKKARAQNTVKPSICAQSPFCSLGFKWGLGLRAQGFGFRFRVQVLGCRTQTWVWGLGLRVRIWGLVESLLQLDSRNDGCSWAREMILGSSPFYFDCQ